jgi:photosystem II stability/assembly factor-like uncharacterized protein
MLRIFLVLIVGLFCVGCASSKARAATPVKVATLVKIKSYGECKMMPNGYLVCPKEGRR